MNLLNKKSDEFRKLFSDGFSLSFNFQRKKSFCEIVTVYYFSRFSCFVKRTGLHPFNVINALATAFMSLPKRTPRLLNKFYEVLLITRVESPGHYFQDVFAIIKPCCTEQARPDPQDNGSSLNGERKRESRGALRVLPLSSRLTPSCLIHTYERARPGNTRLPRISTRKNCSRAVPMR